MTVKGKLALLSATVPLLSLFLGITPTFAQSPVVVSQQVSTRPPVSASGGSGFVPVPQVVSNNMPSTVAKKLPMPVAQLQQTITIVNRDIQENRRGLVNVNINQLRHSGLSTHEIQWVQRQLIRYNHNILSGKFRPTWNSAHTPMSLSVNSSSLTSNITPSTIAAMSTANLSYGWFVASQPYWFQENFWWGESLIANNRATNNFVYDMNFYSVNGFFISLIPAPPINFVVALTAGLAGAYAFWASSNNHGYGVHFNFIGGNVLPTGVFPNQP
jgi:hypothetical protein